MYCPNCGKQIPDNANFCIECGAKIDNQTLKPAETESGKNNKKQKNMPTALKVILSIVCIFAGGFWILAFILTAFKNTEAVSKVKTAYLEKTLPPVIDPIDVECSGCHIQYSGFEIKNSSSPRILIYYTFENNDVEDRHHKFDSVVNEYAYQDGVLLNSTYDSNTAGKDSNTLIKPGGKLTVCSSFILRNTTSPVELKMKEDILFIDEVLGEMIIPITCK